MTDSQRASKWQKANKLKADINKLRWRLKYPEFVVWTAMRSRCNRINDESYKYYGALGIKVKYKTYEEFIKDVGNRPSKEYSIDRIDVLGHYEKGNCRWATKKQQRENQRNPYTVYKR